MQLLFVMLKIIFAVKFLVKRVVMIVSSHKVLEDGEREIIIIHIICTPVSVGDCSSAFTIEEVQEIFETRPTTKGGIN